MRNELQVDCLHSIDDLSEQIFCAFFRKTSIFYQIEQILIVGHFHHHINVRIGVQHFIKLDDVGMVEDLEDANLTLYLFKAIFTLEIIFLFFILGLFMILTATLTPVRSCFASAFSTKIPLT